LSNKVRVKTKKHALTGKISLELDSNLSLLLEYDRKSSTRDT